MYSFHKQNSHAEPVLGGSGILTDWSGPLEKLKGKKKRKKKKRSQHKRIDAVVNSRYSKTEIVVKRSAQGAPFLS